MTALVPSNSGDALAEQRYTLMVETAVNMPMLLAVQLIANPLMMLAFMLILAQIDPTIALLVWLNSISSPALFLLWPLFWAFLVGGANSINLALARNQPAKLSMLFKRRTLVRKYLGAAIIFALATNISLGVALFLPMLLAILSASAIMTLVSAVTSVIVLVACLAQVGFIDLAIVDKNLDSFQALNESIAVAKGNLVVLCSFYLASGLSIAGLLVVAKTFSATTISGYILALIWVTALNFYRVKLYCSMQKRKDGALETLLL